MRAKLVNEAIKHLGPKSKEDILQMVKGNKDAIFKRTEKYEAFGLMEYVEVSYATLVKLFGKPDEGDYKVSTYWMVEDQLGNLAQIYDYKSTNLYDPGLPSIKTFRKLPSYSWHISCKNISVAHDLITYILLNS